MFGRISSRRLVLGPVLMALLLAAQPVAAFSVTSTTGNVGQYYLSDTFAGPRGADCVYQATQSHHVYPLKDISARGPSMYGTSTHNQWVGWRYKIQRTPTSSLDFKTYFTSSVVKAKASQNAPASFVRRTWTVPSNLPTGNYRVQETLYWYQFGSSTIQDGKVVLVIQYYHVKGGGQDQIRQTDCNDSN